MTDSFFNTHLPYNPAIYRAYMLFLKNRENVVGDTPDLPQEVAQIIANMTGDNNHDLIAYTLLQDIPPAVASIITDRFGPHILVFAREVQIHKEEGFANIGTASDITKLFFMAFYIAGLRELEEVLDTGKTKEKIVIALPAAGADIFERLVNGVKGTTSCPPMEQYCEELLAKTAKYLGTSTPTHAPVKSQPATPLTKKSSAFPSFEKTALLNSPTVRTAYELITQRSDAEAQRITVATRIAEILSHHEEPQKSATVAAALLMFGTTNYDEPQSRELLHLFDRDVLNLVSNGNPLAKSPSYLLAAPNDYKAIAIATTLFMLENLATGVDSALVYKQDPRVGAAGVSKALMDLRQAAIKQFEVIKPIMSTSGSPKLEIRYLKQYRDFLKKIEDNIAPTPPKPPQSPKP